MRDVTDSATVRTVLAHAGWIAAVADSTLTYIGLRWLGTVEGTPAVAELIATLGLGAGLLVRTVVAVALVAVLWAVPRRTPALQTVGLAGIATLHVWVVGWNSWIMWG